MSTAVAWEVGNGCSFPVSTGRSLADHWFLQALSPPREWGSLGERIQARDSMFGLWEVITVTGPAYLCVHSWLVFFFLVLILSAHYLNQICSVLFGVCFSSCHLSTGLFEFSAALRSPVKKKHSSDLGPYSN